MGCVTPEMGLRQALLKEHQVADVMPEMGQSGSEGGATLRRHPYPYRASDRGRMEPRPRAARRQD